MDYKAFHNNSAAVGQKAAIQRLQDALGQQAPVGEAPDGLWLVSAAAAEAERDTGRAFALNIPQSVKTWLCDLALLRHVPLAYLIPDPKLLPPESIRFFHVDRSWTDRMIDGALSAANVGTLDMTYRMSTMVGIRQVVAEELNAIVDYENDPKDPDPYFERWDAADLDAPITGMLIRSDLIRRWPDLEVFAYNVTEFAGARPADHERVRLLRRDILARDLMIVLFAGTPIRVEVKEPPVAIRFGVEGEAPNFTVNLRDRQGAYVETQGAQGKQSVTVQVPLRSEGSWAGRPLRVVSALQLTGEIASKWRTSSSDVGSRGVGLNLEQLPYVQVFQGGNEDEGSEHPERDLSRLAAHIGRPHRALTRRGALVIGAARTKRVELKDEGEDDQ